MLISFTQTGAATFGKGIHARAQNLPMREIMEAHRSITAKEFRSGRTAGGSIWPRRKPFPGGRPAGSAALNSGRLYSAVVGGRGRVGSFTRVGKTTAKWGVTLAYARYHRGGARIRVSQRQRAYLHYRGVHLRKSTTTLVIPARRWGGNSAELQKKVAKLIRDHFGGSVAGPVIT